MHLGRAKEVKEAFEQEFGIAISLNAISTRKKKDSAIIGQIRDSFEKGMASEYLASKRQRVRALTQIYEKSMDSKKYGYATTAVKTIDEIVDGKWRGDFNMNVFQQNNHYSDMSVEEIRKKKHEVLNQLERVIIDSEAKEAVNEPN